MSQDTFNCFWRTFILPFFVANNYSVANKPDREEISDAEIEALLSFLYNQPHNLDNFHDWLHQVRNDRNHQLGARSWIKKFNSGPELHGLFNTPSLTFGGFLVLAFVGLFFLAMICHSLCVAVAMTKFFFLIQN